MSDNAKLHKLGWTCRDGTVFVPRQYVHQKEAMGMERPEMYSPNRCKNSSYLCGMSNYPFQRSWYRPENAN